MNIVAIKSWLRQPTTIHSLGVVALVAVSVVMFFFGANQEVAGMCGVASYALVHAGINDDTASRSIEKMIEDAVQAYVAGQMKSALPSILADAPAVAVALTSRLAAPHPTVGVVAP